MPWSHTLPMDQKMLFISAFLKHERRIVDLADDFQISRKTAYKWIERYLKDGIAGLEERSRAAHFVHNATSPKIVQALLAVRKIHKFWGSNKILTIVHKKHPSWKLPARATVCDILKRYGLTRKTKKRRKLTHPGRPYSNVHHPNDLWTIDFKGQFKTRDGIYCYPLTVADSHSRFLLACEGILSPNFKETKAIFIKLFKKYGLPKRIRSDNGSPFASAALARLSSLSAWFISLGIIPELIEPGKPQQNGQHERMHKTLKAEATKPPAGNLRSQQRKFNTFREEYNNLRPHESLGLKTPKSVYRKSNRKMKKRIPKIIYPEHFETRFVSANGCIRWKSKNVRVTSALYGYYIGLEPVADEIWGVYFSTKRLGYFHEGRNRIEDQFGRYVR